MSTSARKLWTMYGVLLFLSAAGATTFAVTRHYRESSEAQQRNAAADFGPTLYVTPVEVTSGERTATLPGEVRPYQQAQIYARVSGYLRKLTVFPGDAVKKNQVIGTIESPETDQQVLAAAADFAIRQRNVERARNLGPSGVIPQQQVDQAEADVKTSQANLLRVQAQQAYTLLRAPFDGVVTARFVDPGALLQAQVPVVEVTDSSKVKVTVYVGQDVAPFLKAGDGVEVTQQERPDLRVKAKVTRVAESLDPRTRTMLSETWIDNQETRLQPGTFVRVTLRIQVPPLPTVPGEAVFVRGDTLVAAVVENGRLKFRPIEPGINDGKRLQIRNGLRGGETVALNVPSELDDGARVRPVPQRAAPPQGR